MAEANGELFYERGLCFTCQPGCGACCKIPGRVELTQADATAMAEHLGLPHRTFLAQFTRVQNDQLLIRERDDGACIMLGEDATCRVHPVRPIQCRTYPFWDEILANEFTWFLERQTCPGIGVGAYYTFEEIAYIRQGGGSVTGYSG